MEEVIRIIDVSVYNNNHFGLVFKKNANIKKFKNNQVINYIKMTYNPDWCIVCGDEEDNGWGNKISLEFKQILIDKGYNITNHGTDICPNCLIKIIKPSENGD